LEGCGGSPRQSVTAPDFAYHDSTASRSRQRAHHVSSNLANGSAASPALTRSSRPARDRGQSDGRCSRDDPVEPRIGRLPHARIEPAPPRHVRPQAAPEVLDPAIFSLRDFAADGPGAGRRRSGRPISQHQCHGRLDRKRDSDMFDHLLCAPSRPDRSARIRPREAAREGAQAFAAVGRASE